MCGYAHNMLASCFCPLCFLIDSDQESIRHQEGGISFGQARWYFQSNLSDTITKSAALVGSSECAKPFKEDPAKQERFDLFLKEKYQGGLRSTSYCGTDKTSEAVRARERLNFEAAAEAITKAKWNTEDGLQTNQQSIEFSRTGDERFILSGGLTHLHSQDEEMLTGNILPKREEFQWRPLSLLLKCFDIVDPFMGKPPPAPRPRSKMDALIPC